MGQLQFMYNQVIHSIPTSWKDALTGNLDNIKNPVFQGHHLIKNHQIYCLNKLNSKDIYSILIEPVIQNLFPNCTTKSFFKIQVLIGKLFTCYLIQSQKTHGFQCFDANFYTIQCFTSKKMLFRFGKIYSPLCSFCGMIDKTPLHFFYNCVKTKLLWDQLK